MRQKSPETFEEKLAQLEELRQAALHSSPEAEDAPWAIARPIPVFATN